MGKIFHCEDTFESFLTAVYYSYKKDVEAIFFGNNLQLVIGGEVVDIDVEEDKAERVRKAIFRDGGREGYQKVYYAFCSDDKFKGVILLKFLKELFKYKKSAFSMLANPVVQNFDDMSKRVALEAHRMKGFVHFVQTTSDVYYAQISPDNNVVELIMPHFADRYENMDFIIHDVVRNIVGVCKSGAYAITKLDVSVMVELSKEEVTIQEVWKRYFDDVAIKERTNARLQNNYLPKRYRKNMSEFD